MSFDALSEEELRAFELPDPSSIVEPPKDIKAIIETTANYVSRAGVGLEAEILSRQGSNPKFAFLSPDHEFHAFYKTRIIEILTGKTIYTPLPTSLPHPVEPESKSPLPSTAPLKYAQQLAKEIRDWRVPSKTLEAPSDPLFNVKVPPTISIEDVDIIKLTAQFVARNGSKFLYGLDQREQQNSVFGFLKPSHHKFPFFQNLVKAYSKIIMVSSELRDEMCVFASNGSKLLEMLLSEAEYKRKKNSDESESKPVQVIDWHNFVVAGTVPFSEEDYNGTSSLDPSCISLDDISRFIHLAFKQDQVVETVEEEADDMDVESEEEMDEQSQECPYCHKLIKVDALSEHIRIELQDPRWHEQRKAYENKHRETNIAENDEITRNLARFAVATDLVDPVTKKRKTGD